MPGFKELYVKLQRHIEINGRCRCTLTNYARCLSAMALHYGCSPLELDEEQIFDYLYYLKTQSQTPSLSYFKHTVYGLRFAYKVMGITNMQVSLPSVKSPQKLPVVLSYEEVRRLIKSPQFLRHRLILAMIYGCGLRRLELINLKLRDVDMDRGMLHIKNGKGHKDRYVPLGHHLIRGLKAYQKAVRPYVWLFNGRSNTGQLQQLSRNGLQWIISKACEQAEIEKHVTAHVLRHSYATHLMEMGLDIMTIKELLGHSDLKSTLVYLHVARYEKENAFCPLDKLYA